MSVEHDPTGAPEGGSGETQGQAAPTPEAAPQPYSWNQEHANFYAQHFDRRLGDTNDPEIRGLIENLARVHGITKAEAKQAVQQAAQEGAASGDPKIKALEDRFAAFENRFKQMDQASERARNQSLMNQVIEGAVAASQYGRHKSPVVGQFLRQIVEAGLMRREIRQFDAPSIAKYVDTKFAELAKALQDDATEKAREQRKFAALQGGASTAALTKEKKNLSKEEAAAAISEMAAAMNESQR